MGYSYLGDKKVKQLYLGKNLVKEAYLGNNLIYKSYWVTVKTSGTTTENKYGYISGDKVEIEVKSNGGYLPPLSSLFSLSGISVNDLTLSWSGTKADKGTITFIMPENNVEIINTDIFELKSGSATLSPFEEKTAYAGVSSSLELNLSTDEYPVSATETNFSCPSYSPSKANINHGVYTNCANHLITAFVSVYFTNPPESCSISQGGSVSFNYEYLTKN